MSLYLPVKNDGGHYAIGVCGRCQMKRYYSQLRQDPNTLAWYCDEGCTDLYDPYRLPMRAADDITLHHPRPDTDLNIQGGAAVITVTDPSEQP